MFLKMRQMVLCACIVVPVLAYAQKAELPDSSAFARGETWEWRQVDTRTKLEETRLRRAVVEVDGAVQFSDGSTNAQISDLLVGGGYEVASEPWRSWPLEVGKKWSFKGDWKRPDGVTGNTKQDVVVLAYEEVTVPAGKFMAYKIEHRGYYSNSKGRNGRQNDTFWYSPEVRADVRHDRDDGYNLYTRELVSHQRSAP